MSLFASVLFGICSCALVSGDGVDAEDEANTGVWNIGYVGSEKNTETPCAINTDNVEYMYTEIIELGDGGTKISFTDTNPAFDVLEIYTLSFWLREGDSWVLDTEAPNISNDSTLIKSYEGGAATYTYVSTLDGECVRFCYRVGMAFDGEYPEIRREVCDEVPTCYEEIKFLEYIRMERERAYYDILEGCTASFIGDSLFGGHGIGIENSWINLLGEKYNMVYNNYGSNGCTLSACEGGANPIITRYTAMADNDPDIIVFEGGRNDFNKCAALGSIEEKDITTYLGAISALVDGLREKYPRAVIIAVSFWNTTTVNKAGATSNSYVEAMLSACESLGVPIINAYDESASGVHMTDKDFRAEYCYVPGDVCHLNIEGMKLVLPFFEKEIARIYGDSMK